MNGIEGKSILQSALFLAVKRGDLIRLKRILARGDDINAYDDSGYTPLMCAIFEQQIEIIEPLLRHGATPSLRRRHHNSLSPNGDTSLHMATWLSDWQVIELLMRSGVDVNAEGAQSATPLMRLAETSHHYHPDGTFNHSAIQNQLTKIRLLKETGADLNRVDIQGRTVLFYGLDKLSVTSLLLEIGAELDVKDKDGNSPLIEACRNGYSETAALLLQMGADVNWQNSSGFSPLMCAVCSGSEQCVRQLIQFGADKGAVDREGNTAEDWAAMSEAEFDKRDNFSRDDPFWERYRRVPSVHQMDHERRNRMVGLCRSE